MSVPARKWRPLHVAMAWVLTRDEQFCTELEADKSADKRPYVGPARLEEAILTSGCFLSEPQGIVCVRRINDERTAFPTSSAHSTQSRGAELGRWTVTPNYAGRFASLAQHYEETGWHDLNSAGTIYRDWLMDYGIVSLGQYLFDRWMDSFRELASRIADDDVNARGTALDGARRTTLQMPPEAVTSAMWLDVDGVVWEGPQAMHGEQPRRWLDITVNWAQLQKHFPAPSPPPLKVRKRIAVNAAIAILGVVSLNGMSQKVREDAIIDRVKIDSGLDVRERFVRGLFAKARQSAAGK